MSGNVFTGYKHRDKVVEKDYGIGTVVTPGTDMIEVSFDRPGGPIRIKLPPERLRPATAPEVEEAETKALLSFVLAEDMGAILRRLVFECAGAATRPLLEDHSDYEFPSRRVQEAVDYVLADWGFPNPASPPDIDAINEGDVAERDRVLASATRQRRILIVEGTHPAELNVGAVQGSMSLLADADEAYAFHGDTAICIKHRDFDVQADPFEVAVAIQRRET